MACNSAAGQSGGGCYNHNNQEEDDDVQKQTTNGVVPNGNDSGHHHQNLCVKCKSSQSISSVTAASGCDVVGGEIGRFCADCFRSNLYGKFRFAVSSNAMISPSDNVLVAFSGGPASRVALQFVHEMQLKAQKNFDASRDRSLPVFGVGVAFVDESAINLVPSDQFDKAIEDIKRIVSNLAPRKEFHIFPIASIYSSGGSAETVKVKELLHAVTDTTGREDLLLHLRMLSLQKMALEHGYTKLVLGTCTSEIACHVIAAMVKGQGFSLSADIQYVDARWEVPVVLPLRDCLAQELNVLCFLDRLKTVEVLSSPRSGINGLVSSFVKLLQEENPSRECTIVRTAGKLTPFHFNKFQESDDSKENSASRRRQKKYNLKPSESLPMESYCPICNGPLKNSDSHYLNGQTNAEILEATCCPSCRFQILPNESSSVEHFFSLLPQMIVSRADNNGSAKERWLREQIQDCLLLDSEDGT